MAGMALKQTDLAYGAAREVNHSRDPVHLESRITALEQKMTRADRLFDEILKNLIDLKKSVNWVEEEYNIDAKDILKAWIKRRRS